MKIFLISPVRNLTHNVEVKMSEYVTKLENAGHEVHVPVRDTNQDDISGYGYYICEDNRTAMALADEIHLWWNPDSIGSIFDLGMAFGMFLYSKPFVLANPEDIEPKEGKCFENMICFWNNRWEKTSADLFV